MEGQPVWHGVYLGIHAKAVVAAVAIDTATDRLNLGGNLFSRARGGPFEQHLARELRNAVCVQGFRQGAAFKDGPEFDEREAMVFLHQQTQAIRKIEFLDIMVPRSFCRRCSLGGAPLRTRVLPITLGSEAKRRCQNP